MLTSIAFPGPRRRAAACALGLLAASFPLVAQTAPKPADDTTRPSEVIELSPFTVSAEASQDGYLAKQTLAATRTKSDLKDVGASIDVLTEAFMNDTGVLDITDALKSIANMSVYDGNVDLNDVHNNQQWFSMTYNARGFRAETLLLDFFPHPIVPIDRYNTENMTFLKGPNAILFGIGSPGGSIGSNYKRPNLSRDRYSLSYTTDSYNSQRVEFDVSKALLENRLGVRVAALDQNRNGFKSPSRNDRKSVYGAVTFRPFSRTTITVTAEDGKWTRLFELNNLVYDAFTPWVMAGMPTVNWQTGKGQNSAGKGNFTRTFESGLAVYNTGPNLVYVEGSRQPIQNWQNMARSASWDSAGVPAVDRGQIANKTFSKADNVLKTPDGKEWRIDLEANSWGEGNLHQTRYRAKNVFLEQNLARGLDLELAGNLFDVEYRWNAFGNQNQPTITADPNELLPDGTANPNVGRPYLESVRQQVHRERREHKNARATLAYELDLERHKVWRGLGLGRYRLLGLYEDQEMNTFLAVGRVVNTTPLPGFNPALNNTQNGVARRYYLKPGESIFQAEGGIGSILGVPLGTGINLDAVMSAESPRRSVKKTESWVGAIQAQWWQAREGYSRITALYGERRDTVFTQAMTFARGANGAWPGNYADWSSALQSGSWLASTETVAQTKTYSLVLRPLQALSLFYNYSDLFNTGDPNFRDIFGNPNRPTYGDTTDYGIKLSLLKNRMEISLTQFETVQFDQTFQSTGDFVTNPNRIWESLPGRANMILPTFRANRDDTTDGTEVGLAANVTNNWRMRLSAGRQNSLISRYADEVQAYLDLHSAEWQQNKDVLLLNPTTTITTVGQAAADYQQRVRDARAIIGRKQSNIREYNASFNTTYTLSRGFAKGLSLGTGIRWGSEGVIGYARTPAGLLDLGHPYKGAETFNVDLNLGYSRKLARDRVKWEVFVNIFNLLDVSDDQARNAIDSGNASHDPIVIRRYLMTPRWFQVRNTFTF